MGRGIEEFGKESKTDQGRVGILLNLPLGSTEGL